MKVLCSDSVYTVIILQYWSTHATNIFLIIDKNHEMDLVMSHQVDSTLDEEPSGGEEEDGNQDETKSAEILSKKATVTDNGVPKKPEYNKIVATTSPNTICNNKSAYTSGREFENAYNIKIILVAQQP